MKNLRLWVLFVACSIVWLIASLWMAPAMSGGDVFIFRDAGWNLAAYGHFESAGLLYMRDLAPKLYSHYPPIFALLFSGYASVFPRNAYAGTVFNLLLGLLAAGVSLYWVLRQPPSWLRTGTACGIAVLPVAFVFMDRPEPIGLVLSVTALALVARDRVRPVWIGLLIALVFLAHPFAAVAESIWAVALLLSRNWTAADRWLKTLKETVITGLVCMAAIGSVALLYYHIDHNSLRRFAAHAFGKHSGVGAAGVSPLGHSLIAVIRHEVAFSMLAAWMFMGTLATFFFLAGWLLLRRKDMQQRDWLTAGAGLVCGIVSFGFFPTQPGYLMLLAFFIPLGLLITGAPGGKLASAAVALLALAIFVRIPAVVVDVIQRVEQRASYAAAKGQPAYLLARLASPDAVVGLAGGSGSYDLFKPKFRHLVAIGYMGNDAYSGIAGVANCYASFHGADKAQIPLPEVLDASNFEIIQPAPQHMWITLFGHRVMRAQWGYGCDLYVRKGEVRSVTQPRP